jgi:hypothetical protein
MMTSVRSSSLDRVDRTEILLETNVAIHLVISPSPMGRSISKDAGASFLNDGLRAETDTSRQRGDNRRLDKSMPPS